MQASHYVRRIEKAQSRFTQHTGISLEHQYLTALVLQDFHSQGKGWRDIHMTKHEAAEQLSMGKAIRVSVRSRFSESFTVFVDRADLD